MGHEEGSEVVIATSQQRPMILAIEDLQWIDPTSEECLGVLADSAAACRILLLGTYRHGYRPPWLAKSYATQLVLRRLGPAESLSIVKSAAAAAPLSAEIANAIVARADGVPFFLEELARALSERAGTAAVAAIPETIQGALAARLDQLPVEDKAVLQAAAVVGEGRVGRAAAGDRGLPGGGVRAGPWGPDWRPMSSCTRQGSCPRGSTRSACLDSGGGVPQPAPRSAPAMLHAAAVRAIERLTPQLIERTPSGSPITRRGRPHGAGHLLLAPRRAARAPAAPPNIGRLPIRQGARACSRPPRWPRARAEGADARLALVGSLIATAARLRAGGSTDTAQRARGPGEPAQGISRTSRAIRAACGRW